MTTTPAPAPLARPDRRDRTPRLLGPRDAAAALGVSERTIRRWIAEGLLPARRLPGNQMRIAWADLERVAPPAAAAVTHPAP